MFKHIKSETLHAYRDVASWQRNNYILQGYRPISNSYLTSIHSLTYIHNQTVNIYTHLLGLGLSVLATYTSGESLTSRYSTASHEDTIVFGSFFAGLTICLGFSSAFHTFSNHSQATYEQWLALDLLGILCLVAGSWVPGVYYGFYCRRATLAFYITMISALTATCTIVLLVPRFRTPEWKNFRTTMFLTLGISGFIPMTCAAIEYGILQAHQQMGWGWFILEAVFYMSGVAVYATKYPEKASPGSYDILGSSHQIFHVLVLCGALAHFTGIVKAFEYNHNPVTRLC